MAKQLKVDMETARADFDRMCLAHRICIDPEDLDEGELKDLEVLRVKYSKMIARGDLAINEDGNPIYTTPGGKAIQLKKATGATFVAMGAAGMDFSRRNSLALGELSGLAPGEIAKLEAPDYQICVGLTQLFLSDR